MYKLMSFILMLFFMTSCYVSVKSIITAPQFYNNQMVKLKGYVAASVAYNDMNIIYLQEGRYSIPVISKYFFPIKNQTVIVKGLVKRNFIYHNRDTLPVVIILNEKNYNFD